MNTSFKTYLVWYLIQDNKNNYFLLNIILENRLVNY